MFGQVHSLSFSNGGVGVCFISLSIAVNPGYAKEELYGNKAIESPSHPLIPSSGQDFGQVTNQTFMKIPKFPLKPGGVH